MTFDESDFEIVRPPFLVPMPDWRDLSRQFAIEVWRDHYDNCNNEHDALSFCVIRSSQHRPAIVQVAAMSFVFVRDDWSVRLQIGHLITTASYRSGFLCGIRQQQRSATPATRKA